MNQSFTNDDIVLNYNDIYDHSNGMNYNSIIHRNLLEEFSAQIRRDAPDIYTESLYSQEDSDDFQHKNYNYFITGNRGSGKSTFLRLLGMKLENEVDKKRFKRLCKYDPSESFGVEDNFFISVVAALKSSLEEAVSIAIQNRRDHNFYLELCKDLMKKLDVAITRLSQEKKELSGMSEHNASLLRSDNPEMSTEIRRNFRKVVSILCYLHNLSAFIITIDDVDTRSDNGYRVLEGLRLYVAKSRIIVLMAGDKSSNMEHIRERHFMEYNIEYHRNDDKGKDARMDAVIKHAAQYFTKLFPISHQRELSNLLILTRNHHSKGRVLLANNKGGIIALRDYVTAAFKCAISYEEYELGRFVDLFFCFPLRTILQIIEFWATAEVDIWEIVDKHDFFAINDEEHKSKIDQVAECTRVALNRALTDLLRESYYKFESVDIDDIRIFYAILLKHCQNMGDLEHGYFLSGDMGNTLEDKYITILLAVTFRKRINSVSGFISYLFYGPATVALYDKAVQQTRVLGYHSEARLRNLRKSFDEYLHVGSWHSASRWARHANMIWCYDQEFEGIHSGILRLRHKNMVDVLNSYIDIDERADQNQCLNALSLIVCMNKSADRDNSYFVSIYSYLAFILRYIEAYDRAVSNGFNENKARAALRKVINNYFPIKTCSRPEWQSDSYDSEQYNTTIIDFTNHVFWKNNNSKLNEYIDSIYNEFKEVYEEAKKACEERAFDDDVSPRKMGELWSNFYYMLRSICHSSQPGKYEYENLDVYTSNISMFAACINYFFNSFCRTGELEEISKMSQLYRYLIGRFPLTQYLIKASSDLHKKISRVAVINQLKDSIKDKLKVSLQAELKKEVKGSMEKFLNLEGVEREIIDEVIRAAGHNSVREILNETAGEELANQFNMEAIKEAKNLILKEENIMALLVSEEM